MGWSVLSPTFFGDRVGLGLLPPHLGWERKPGYLSFNASSRLVPLTASSRKPLLVLAFSLLPEPTHPPPQPPLSLSP